MRGGLWIGIDADNVNARPGPFIRTCFFQLLRSLSLQPEDVAAKFLVRTLVLFALSFLFPLPFALFLFLPN